MLGITRSSAEPVTSGLEAQRVPEIALKLSLTLRKLIVTTSQRRLSQFQSQHATPMLLAKVSRDEPELATKKEKQRRT